MKLRAISCSAKPIVNPTMPSPAIKPVSEFHHIQCDDCSANHDRPLSDLPDHLQHFRSFDPPGSYLSHRFGDKPRANQTHNKDNDPSNQFWEKYE